MSSIERKPSHTSSDEEKVDKDVVPETMVPHLTQGEDGGRDDQLDAASFDKKDIPFRYRLLAMSMILFFATGSSFAEGTLGPLKSTIRKKLKITRIDYWGAAYVFVVIGAVISAAGTNVNHFVIESTQSKLYAHWFGGANLAFVYGIDIAWNRITGIIARSTSVPMSEINGFWGWALWIPTIVCFFNLALCVGYLVYERAVPKTYRPPLGKDARAKEGVLKKRVTLNTPKFFWILCGTQMFQNAAVATYTSNLADIQTQTRGTSKLAAGYNASIQGVIPIVLTPLTGFFFDRFGYRMFFGPPARPHHAQLVCERDQRGDIHLLHPDLGGRRSTVGYGVRGMEGFCECSMALDGADRSKANGNTMVLEVAAGAIQDRSSTNSYNNVIYLLIAIKAVQVAWGPFYDYLDGRWLGHSLRRSELQRLEIRKQAIRGEVELPGWKVSRVTMFVVGGQLTALIIVAWVVYIVYSLGT
ncbi:hypothetical protein IAR55_007182 [Kwoniella newhampshirensis]|uniref:Major facilitator superfamily (MFS) profile domain-containing protein n=1 Tax=Kwoniella newhampshirensis TaxID=1651941 RepID=A0AAW0YT46_9TREE